jgi:hypothetical protein
MDLQSSMTLSPIQEISLSFSRSIIYISLYLHPKALMSDSLSKNPSSIEDYKTNNIPTIVRHPLDVDLWSD